MKNATHESYAIAMQNLVDLMAKAGYLIHDDIITAWEFEDRFVFITEEDDASGQFSLDEFYKAQNDFGQESLTTGSLLDCWARLEHLQEEGRPSAVRYFLEIYSPDMPNAEWQRLSEVNAKQKANFDSHPDNVDGVIDVVGLKHRIQTVIRS